MGYGQGPPADAPPEGPPVDVRNFPGLQIAVQRAYGGTRSASVLWAGKVVLMLSRKPLIEIEVSLMRDKSGGAPWVALPRREYQSNGQAQRTRTVYFADQSCLAAIVEAIEATKQGSPF